MKDWLFWDPQSKQYILVGISCCSICSLGIKDLAKVIHVLRGRQVDRVILCKTCSSKPPRDILLSRARESVWAAILETRPSSAYPVFLPSFELQGFSGMSVFEAAEKARSSGVKVVDRTLISGRGESNSLISSAVKKEILRLDSEVKSESQVAEILESHKKAEVVE